MDTPQTTVRESMFTNATVYDHRGELLVACGSNLYRIVAQDEDPALNEMYLIGETVCAFATASGDRDEDLVATWEGFDGEYKDIYVDREDLPVLGRLERLDDVDVPSALELIGGDSSEDSG